MSSRDAVRIASRIIAAYILIWALDAASYIPANVYAAVHHSHEASIITGNNYWENHYLVSVGISLLRVAGLLIVAFWFYQCGPGAQKYFLPESFTSNTANTE
jgi:hypothetical protein